MSALADLRVEATRCIGCGACQALCPTLFALDAGKSRVVAAPAAGERGLAEVARWICPTDAIRLGGAATTVAAADDDLACTLHDQGADGLVAAPRFLDLAAGAERVRWSLDDVPWGDLDPSRATPALRTLVREMALSESATYTATQRFLEAFFEDLELSKWISVWFYEETRHPHVLVEWLRRVGDDVPAEVEVQGRVSTPLMRSAVGTLVSNVISEITAAQAYRRLAARAPEPVLAELARKIAGDEARHAAAFFRFARGRLMALPPASAQRERLRGLEVLRAWVGGTQPTTHPVAEMMDRLEGADEDVAALGVDFGVVQSRVVRVVGALLGVPLARHEDVVPAWKGLLGQRGRS